MSKSDLTIGGGSSGAIDNAPVVTHLPGGTIAFQTGKASDYVDGQFPNETLRSGVDDGGSYRANADGSIEKFGAITAHAVTAPPPTDNPLDSAKTPWGSPASSINRDTVLNFMGEEIPVRVAVTLGWLREDGPGKWAVTGRHVAEITALRGQR